MRTCKPTYTVRQRREKWPRKAKRARHLHVELARVEAEAWEVARMTAGAVLERMLERARTWSQRANTVELWIHWDAGTMVPTKHEPAPAPKWVQGELL